MRKNPCSPRFGVTFLNTVNSALIRATITDSTSGFGAYGTSAIQFLAREYPHDDPEPEVRPALARPSSFLVAMHLSVSLSRLTEENNKLTQELALLREKIDESVAPKESRAVRLDENQVLLAVGIRPHADELRIALRLEWLVGTTGAVDRGPVRDLRDGLRRRGTIAMKSLPADGTVHRRRNPALRRAATLPSSPPPAELEKSATAARPAETRKLRHATDLGGSRREGGNGGRAAGGRTRRQGARSPVGFIDDDFRKREKVLHGLPIFSGDQSLAVIHRASNADEILGSTAKISPARLRSLVAESRRLDMHVRRMKLELHTIADSELGWEIQEAAAPSTIGAQPHQETFLRASSVISGKEH